MDICDADKKIILSFFKCLLKLFKYIEVNDNIFEKVEDYLLYLDKLTKCSKYISNFLFDNCFIEIGEIDFNLTKDDVSNIYYFYKDLNNLPILYEDKENVIEFIDNYELIRKVLYNYFKDYIEVNDKYIDLLIVDKIHIITKE